jgi:hypothetical protein
MWQLAHDISFSAQRVDEAPLNDRGRLRHTGSDDTGLPRTVRLPDATRPRITCLTAGWSLRQRDGVARRRRISGGTRHAGTIIVTITVVAIETHSLRPRPDEKILVASAEFERGLYFLWELINTKCLEF